MTHQKNEKKSQYVHLDALSALKNIGRFENAMPVTLRAFGAISLIDYLTLKFCGMGRVIGSP